MGKYLWSSVASVFRNGRLSKVSRAVAYTVKVALSKKWCKIDTLLQTVVTSINGLPAESRLLLSLLLLLLGFSARLQHCPHAALLRVTADQKDAIRLDLC